MTPPADTTLPSGRRRHDAQASRQALLDTAGRLFDERGYDATTVRDIGEQAGVDPALIARYFGGKEGLYLAVLSAPGRPSLPSEPLDALATMLTRSEKLESGPLLRAMVDPTLTGAVRDQIRDISRANAVDPLANEFAARGLSEPELRAELLCALAVGVSLTRASGTLPRLAERPINELVEMLSPIVRALQTSEE